MMMRESFRGWNGVKASKTGFFRVAELEGRWWFIDPEGNAFLSLGLNHISPELLFKGYNRAKNEERYGPAPDPFKFDEFRKSPGWDIWNETLREDYRKWGMNTIGALSNITSCPPEIPYAICINFANICHWMPASEIRFPDVFSNSFEKHCDEIARRRCSAHARNPNLIGYFYADTPILSRECARRKSGDLQYDLVRGPVPIWPDAMKSVLGKGAGKEVYVELMHERYGDITAFNSVYSTNCESFDTLFRRHDLAELQPADPERAAQDDETLLWLILDRFYQVARDAIRRYDADHLILGDRYNGNSVVPDAAIETMKPYVDVFSVQYYGFYEEQRNDLEKWHRITGKPVFLTDSCFSATDENMPNPFGPHVDSQEARAAAYEEYARAVFALPYVIGWNWCGYIDEWTVSEGPRQHSGVKDAFENPYEPLVETMRRVNRNVYDIATEGSENGR
ncbi:hypothetical protein ACFL1X_14685 [Candidatus Hydrogenedentota bacterium]